MKFFCSAFSCIRTEYCSSPYSVRMPENAGQMRTRITPNTDTFYTVQTTLMESFFYSEIIISETWEKFLETSKYSVIEKTYFSLSLSLLNQIILEFAKFISTLVWVNMKKSVKRFCKRIIQTINPFMHGAEKLPSIWYMMRYKKWKSCNVWSFFNIIRGHTYYSARVDVVYTYYFISFSKDWIK